MTAINLRNRTLQNYQTIFHGIKTFVLQQCIWSMLTKNRQTQNTKENGYKNNFSINYIHMATIPWSRMRINNKQKTNHEYRTDFHKTKGDLVTKKRGQKPSYKFKLFSLPPRRWVCFKNLVIKKTKFTPVKKKIKRLGKKPPLHHYASHLDSWNGDQNRNSQHHNLCQN